jgi:hypothetical protein
MTTTEYRKTGGGGVVVPAEEIERRLAQGDEFNFVYNQAYDAYMNNTHDAPKARKYANATLLTYGQDFFQKAEGLSFNLEEQESRERLYSLVYDRRRIAQKLGKYSESKFDQKLITHIPWAVLQTLATDLITSKLLEEFIALFAHYLTRENCDHTNIEVCPNSLRPDNKTVRLYCYKPTQENLRHVHMLYLSLQEELGKLTNAEFMELQTIRESAIESHFAPRVVEEEEEIVTAQPQEEEKIVQEPKPQKLPEVIPATPALVPVVKHTTGFTEQASGFSTILTIKNSLIAELEVQVVAMAEKIAELEERQESVKAEQEEAENSLWAMLEEAQEKLKEEEDNHKATQAAFEKFKLETDTFTIAKNNAQRTLHRATTQLNDALKSVKEALTVFVND